MIVRHFWEQTLLAAETGAGAATVEPVVDAVDVAETEADATVDATVDVTDDTKPTVKPSVVAVTDESVEAARGTQARIDRLTADKWEERRRAAAAEARILELQAQIDQRKQVTADDPTAADPGEHRYTQAELESHARRLALTEAGEMRFREQVEAMGQAGRAEYKGDFDTAVGNLTKLGPLPREFIAAALETEREGIGKAADIIYSLGQDLNEADRILSIRDPQRQAVALAKYAADLSGKKKAGSTDGVSKASTPIKSVVGATGASARTTVLSDPNASMEEWMAEREKQDKAYKERRNRGY